MSYTLRNHTHTHFLSSICEWLSSFCAVSVFACWCKCVMLVWRRRPGAQCCIVEQTEWDPQPWHRDSASCEYQICGPHAWQLMCFTPRLCDWACGDGLMSGWRGEFCIGHNVFGMHCCFKLNWAGRWHVPWWTAFDWKPSVYYCPFALLTHYFTIWYCEVALT